MSEMKSIRVVVAEDDFFIAEEIIRSVRSLGWEVVGEAATGKEAVEQTMALSPDLVLMDIKMPEMNGIDASMEIQERRPTPVVIITAHETRDLLDEASEAGVAAYLTKPPTPAQIERAGTVALARFQDLVEVRRLNQELEKKNTSLQEALDRVETLEGILTVCSSCRKIPDEKGDWVHMEVYLTTRTKAQFSHGFCPSCYEEFVAQIDDLDLG